MFANAVNSILDGFALVSGVHPLVLPALILLPLVPILAHYAQQDRDQQDRWEPTHVTVEVRS